jgi:hypothetical protein
MNTTSPLGRLDINSHPEVPWKSWGGAPAPLSGDTPLIREANQLHEDWRKRSQFLADAKRECEDARLGVMALHGAYVEEVRRAAEAGERSTLSADLQSKRDGAERVFRGTAWDESINGASAAVAQAAEQHSSFLENNWPALIGELRPEAAQVVRDYAKAYDELRKKLEPLEGRWAELLEHSRQIIGGVHDFVREDLPALGEYAKSPLPSADAIERNGGVIPAPVTSRPLAEVAAK